MSFAVVQFAPGGPVERVIAQLSGADTGATSRISGSPGGDFGARGTAQGASGLDATTSKYRGASAATLFFWVVRNCAAVYGVIPLHAGPTLPLPGFRRAGYASVGGLPTTL